MNRELKVGEFEEKAVRGLSLEFLECVNYINSTISEENTTEEIESIHEKIDDLCQIGEEVYSEIIGDPVTVPSSPHEVNSAISMKSRQFDIPEKELQNMFWRRFDKAPGARIRSVWLEFLLDVEREQRIEEVKNGSTTVDDWQ